MSDYTHWYDPDFEGPFEKGEQIEKLKTANYVERAKFLNGLNPHEFLAAVSLLTDDDDIES